MSSENEHLLENKKTPSFFLSIRFLSACLVFMGVAAQYMQKIDMSIGIVCMINHTALNDTKSYHVESFKSFPGDDQQNDTCLFKPKNNTDHSDGPFAWSSEVQGAILSSYFYGYMITQIPSGWLSFRIGGRRVLAFSMLFGSLLTMCVSEASRISYYALIVTRFVTGVVHGAVWPAMSAMFVNWAPPLEKSRLIGMSGAGSWIGNVIALPLGSYLCVNGFDGGWSSIFYVFGTIGITWFITFMLLTSDYPENHKLISSVERDYLVKTTVVNKKTSVPRKTPWMLILKSTSCWSIFIVHLCTNWANYLFLTELPSFMNDILRFDIKANGFYSTLPYLACWALSITFALISDSLITRKILSIKRVRMLMNCGGFAIAIISTFGLYMTTCSNPYLGVAFLTTGLGFLGMNTGAGYIVNINEVGGIYSGILFGISNTIGTIPGLVAPYIVGVVTKHKLQTEWNVIFLISIGVYSVGFIASLLFTGSETFYPANEYVEESQIQNEEASTSNS